MAARIGRSFGHARPRGPVDGPPALVIPGFVASDQTCLPLRRALADAGWRVHGWGLGLNKGVTADLLDRLEGCIDRMGANEPVLIVGWSLGGVFAREIARHRPEKVRAVISLGSPISGDLRQNNVWRLYEVVAGHKIDQTPVQRILERPPVPSLAIWSRKDGIVAPRAAYGLEEERDEAIEIDARHMAFALSRRTADEVVLEIDRFLKRHN